METVGIRELKNKLSAYVRRTKLIYPDATAVTYVFNKAGQLASLQDWASRSASYTYWPDGAQETATNPDTSVATYTYDNARRAIDTLHQGGATTIGHYAYTLDSAGNVMVQVTTNSSLGSFGTWPTHAQSRAGPGG